MLPIDPPQPAARRRRRSQAGAFAVEFALVLLFFFTIVYGVIEMARLIYIFNTLQEVTRSAAHFATRLNFRDATAKSVLRQRAIFRTSPGTLMFGAPVTDEHVRIDYLALARNAGGALTLTPIQDAALPNCPARNRLVCTADPHDANCIRYVRVRVCQPGSGDACDPVGYAPLVGLIPLQSLMLPTSTTIVKAESLGYQAGQALCP